jgi:hypothetical protein
MREGRSNRAHDDPKRLLDDSFCVSGNNPVSQKSRKNAIVCLFR